MLFWKKVIVGDQQRALVTRRGRFVQILGPGTYRLAGLPRETSVETYNVSDKALPPAWTAPLRRCNCGRTRQGGRWKRSW